MPARRLAAKQKELTTIQDNYAEGIEKCEADKHRERTKAEVLNSEVGKMSVKNKKCQAKKEAIEKEKEGCWCYY